MAEIWIYKCGTCSGNLLANVEFYRGDKKIFSADTYIGSVLPASGQRHGAFSLNADTRTARHFYDDLINIMIDDAIPDAWLMRQVLEEQTSYAGALKRLRTERTDAPVYYILAGLQGNEGAVIEKGYNGSHAYYELSESQWFLVQTNYDRDQPDPVTDPRRIPVEKRLTERGNIHFEEHELMNEFMSIWPTFNIATIMTAVMVPSTSYHNSTAWYGNNPTNKEDLQHRI